MDIDITKNLGGCVLCLFGGHISCLFGGSGQLSLSIINSSVFWQQPDTGCRSPLHEAKRPTPHALVLHHTYSHTQQNKWYVMTLVHVTCLERVNKDRASICLVGDGDCMVYS